MRVLDHPPPAQALLDQFHNAGGIVDFVPVDTGNSISEESHRLAAIAAIKHLDCKNVQTGGYTLDVVRSKGMTPQRITPLDFLGRWWDQSRRRLIIQRIPKDGRVGELFYAGDREIKANGIEGFLPSFGPEQGYAFAFAEPPYPLNLPGAKVQTLFDAINAAILPELFSPETVIHRWPTDWSSYFDAGHEWWGAFFWTIAQPNRPIVCIAASATD